MLHLIKTIVIGTAMALVAGWLWRRWRKAQQFARQELAVLQFPELRDALQTEFLAAANDSGKPRGLRWIQCDLNDRQIFARDRVSSELHALVGVTVSFEAIVGGDMEDVEAVSNLRSATAIFIHRGNNWTTDGHVIFNLEPHEALGHYEHSLEQIKPIKGQGTE